MATKSNPGKTNKYSGVVKSVQNAQQQQEEPRIRPEQVIAAFRSFGFEPNQNNHNDIGYWTMKGQSEGAKLMEELHKRRVEENKKEDDKKKTEEAKNKVHQDIIDKQTADKVTMPRLSDEDIAALFDEYGLPAPDPEWTRSHLPNDPKKIRSILEMQRKAADDMLKKHSKNAVNSLPEVPKAGAAAQMPAQAPMMGMGGPASPMGMQAGMIPGDTPPTPFFVGDHAIVRITNPTNPNASTTWLVDVKKKVLRPFMSEEAFRNAFENPEEAEKAIVTISSKDLGPGGVLEGFTPLKGEKGVSHDGSMKDIEFSPAQIQRRYGKQPDIAGENKALSMLDGLFSQLNKPK